MTDASPRDTRPLKLVKEFNSEATHAQWGYQKLDDLTVLHRRAIPVHMDARGNAMWNVEISVYDFGSYQVTTSVSALTSPPLTPAVSFKSFSEVEGKQSIRDAHRALCELDGHPPALDEVMGYVMELQKNVSVTAPFKLKPQGG